MLALLHRLASTRVLLAPFLLSSCVLVYGYSGILTSYMTITVPPKLLEKVTGIRRKIRRCSNFPEIYKNFFV